MQTVTSNSIVSSSIALQLLSNSKSGEDQIQKRSQESSISSQASKYIPGGSLDRHGLDGVYADPRLKADTQDGSKLARNFVGALENTLATDVKDYRQEALSQLEAAIGRPLDEGETFGNLGSQTRSTLPKNVLSSNRSVQEIEFSFSAMMSRAKNIDLDSSLVAGQPDELRGLDMTKKQDRQAVVDYAIRFQTMINSIGVKTARQDDVAAEMLDKSLHQAGVENEKELLSSYAELHRSRFEAGEFSVVFGGVRITKDNL